MYKPERSRAFVSLKLDTDIQANATPDNVSTLQKMESE